MVFSLPSRPFLRSHSTALLFSFLPIRLQPFHRLCASSVNLVTIKRATYREESQSTRLQHFVNFKSMATSTHSEAKNMSVGVDALDIKKVRPSRLVVCFDGTGNRFQGDTSDTNIVKLYEKFDRSDPNQFHYYQRKSEYLAVSLLCCSTPPIH